jgi:hypothetical protein
MSRALALICLLAACNSPEPDTITGEVACEEQAVAFCDVSGQGDECRTWYRGVCGFHYVDDPASLPDVPLAAHLGCLETLYSLPAPVDTHLVPSECRATWY